MNGEILLGLAMLSFPALPLFAFLLHSRGYQIEASLGVGFSAIITLWSLGLIIHGLFFV